MKFFELSKDRESALQAASEAVRSGELVIFPTETVYGLFFSEKARDKAYRLKGRDLSKPCAYHVGSFESVYALAGTLDGEKKAMLEKKLPGPCTFLVCGGAGEKIGIRYPDHPEACAFLKGAGIPVFGTSANRSGQTSPRSAGETRELWDDVAVVVDGGTVSGRASEVIDLTGPEPKIIRTR
ncbi:L-threonylcarbamoyladenylate synthase [bacterium]|nr:L-threonylcarbamoyladenylate synthase [bacterium]